MFSAQATGTILSRLGFLGMIAGEFSINRHRRNIHSEGKTVFLLRIACIN
jgi:hypothetical protein